MRADLETLCAMTCRFAEPPIEAAQRVWHRDTPINGPAERQSNTATISLRASHAGGWEGAETRGATETHSPRLKVIVALRRSRSGV